MKKRFSFAVLAVTLGAVALLGPGRASAAHEDCGLVVNPPATYGNIAAISSAEIKCGSVKRTIHFTMSMTVDGTLADSSDRTCHKRTDCWTYVFANDDPADQLWCSTATVRIGGHTVGPVTRCEADATV
jgi:hypothetical protein